MRLASALSSGSPFAARANPLQRGQVPVEVVGVEIWSSPRFIDGRMGRMTGG